MANYSNFIGFYRSSPTRARGCGSGYGRFGRSRIRIYEKVGSGLIIQISNPSKIELFSKYLLPNVVIKHRYLLYIYFYIERKNSMNPDPDPGHHQPDPHPCPTRPSRLAPKSPQTFSATFGVRRLCCSFGLR